MKYKFKISKVKGKEYLQILKDGEFHKHIGSPSKVLKQLNEGKE